MPDQAGVPDPDAGVVVPDTQQAPDLLAPDTNPPTPDLGPPTPCAVCTDPPTCCSSENLICVGDPDKGVVCTCDTLWDCDASQTQCLQPAPAPGDGDWSCTLSAGGYSCVGSGAVQDPSKWSCAGNAGSQEMTCVRAWLPNPCNTATGASQWTCSMTDLGTAWPKILCVR